MKKKSVFFEKYKNLKDKLRDWKKNDYKFWKRYVFNPWKKRRLKKLRRRKKKIERRFKNYGNRYKVKSDKKVKNNYFSQRGLLLIENMNRSQRNVMTKNLFHILLARNNLNRYNFHKRNQQRNNLIYRTNTSINKPIPFRHYFKQSEYKQKKKVSRNQFLVRFVEIRDLYRLSNHKEVIIRSVNLIEYFLTILSNRFHFKYNGPSDFLKKIEQLNLKERFLFLEEIVDFKNFLVFFKNTNRKFTPENSKSIFSILYNLTRKLKEKSNKNVEKNLSDTNNSIIQKFQNAPKEIHRDLQHKEIEHNKEHKDEQEVKKWQELESLIENLAKLKK